MENSYNLGVEIGTMGYVATDLWVVRSFPRDGIVRVESTEDRRMRKCVPVNQFLPHNFSSRAEISAVDLEKLRHELLCLEEQLKFSVPVEEFSALQQTLARAQEDYLVREKAEKRLESQVNQAKAEAAGLRRMLRDRDTHITQIEREAERLRQGAQQFSLYEQAVIDPTATCPVIARRCRHLLGMCHPDKGGIAQDAARITEIERLLTNLDTRNIYDSEGLQAARDYYNDYVIN